MYIQIVLLIISDEKNDKKADRKMLVKLIQGRNIASFNPLTKMDEFKINRKP